MKSRNSIWNLWWALVLCSCNSWLDVELINQSAEAKLFSTERGFTEALAGVYYDMSESMLYGQNLSFGMIEIMSRTYDYSAIPNEMKIFRDYDYEDADMEKYIYAIWRAFYANIAAINNILEWSDKNASVLSEARRNQVKGEALALRAMHHYDVYRLFAPDVKRDRKARILPWQDKFGVKAPEVYSTEDYLGLVVADLNEAIRLLENDPIRSVVPYEWGNGEKENKDQSDMYVARMNYYAAKALLARVYLDMGGEYKKQARELAEEVIESEKFALLDYEKSLKVENESDKDLLFSDEHIFSLRNKNIKESAKGMHKKVLESGGNLQMAGGFQIGTYEGDLEDFRLEWFQSLVYIRKFTLDNNERFFPKVPLIRLSEMYLIAAEGWMEDDPAHASELLQVFKQSRTSKEIQSQIVTEELILQEIRKEFIGEGMLFFTYKRLHHTILGNNIDEQMAANDRIFVFPLPEVEYEYGNSTKN
ncbi:MAG: RagB/SusD family nutrient uptake outer membrane protein [Odoribacter sp.]|nr:RagB/SusD family nutrient uptake outer membrane protein [Odoribacter sp.]